MYIYTHILCIYIDIYTHTHTHTVEVKILLTPFRICKMLIILPNKRDHTKCMLLFI